MISPVNHGTLLPYRIKLWPHDIFSFGGLAFLSRKSFRTAWISPQPPLVLSTNVFTKRKIKHSFLNLKMVPLSPEKAHHLALFPHWKGRKRRDVWKQGAPEILCGTLCFLPQEFPARRRECFLKRGIPAASKQKTSAGASRSAPAWLSIIDEARSVSLLISTSGRRTTDR